MKIGIIDSTRNCYVSQPDIEQACFGDTPVRLFQVSGSDQLPDEIAECDGLISWHLVPVDAALIDRLDNCRAIVRAAVGYDNIDLAAARRRGIAVANVPDYGTEEVADHTLAMALGLLRHLRQGHRVVSNGSWDWREVGELPRLSMLRVGLIGFGRIGMAAALRFKAFGCDVAFYDPERDSGAEKSLGVRRCESLQELLATSDLISIHAPLTERTHHLISHRELQLLEGKYLINTARGPIIDSSALLQALAHRRLRGLALDVYEDERQPIPALFDEADNVILSPHVAFYSQAALPELRHKAASVLKSILEEGHHRNILR